MTKAVYIEENYCDQIIEKNLCDQFDDNLCEPQLYWDWDSPTAQFDDLPCVQSYLESLAAQLEASDAQQSTLCPQQATTCAQLEIPSAHVRGNFHVFEPQPTLSEVDLSMHAYPLMHLESYPPFHQSHVCLSAFWMGNSLNLRRDKCIFKEPSGLLVASSFSSSYEVDVIYASDRNDELYGNDGNVTWEPKHFIPITSLYQSLGRLYLVVKDWLTSLTLKQVDKFSTFWGKQMLRYKGYVASVRVDETNNEFLGKVESIEDLITFRGEDMNELKQGFHDAVDSYLAFCSRLGKKPDKNFSGNITFRTDEQTHREISNHASVQNLSINGWLEKAVKKTLNEERFSGRNLVTSSRN